jgi:hypothetical protein
MSVPAGTEGGTFAAGPITLPDWLPTSVARQARLIEARCLSAKQRAILRRLATDPRMRGVWGQLTCRERQGGGFLHPAQFKVVRCLEKSVFTKDQIQQEALSELLDCVFTAANDEVQVSKPGDGAYLKAKLLEKARMLREIADDMTAINSAYPLAAADAAALRRVAGWHEDGAARLRPPSDPLTIRHDRGDRVVRGVQIIIAAWLRENFRKSLDGTAATLASVALGKKASPRVTRSAFSSQKRR